MTNDKDVGSSFTPEQKAHIQELMLERVGRLNLKRDEALAAQREAMEKLFEETLTEKLAEETERIRERIRAELSAKPQPTASDAPDEPPEDESVVEPEQQPEQKQSTTPTLTEAEELARLRRSNYALRKTDRMNAALEGLNFVNRSQVIDLTARRVKYSKEVGDWVAVDNSGKIRQNKNLQPLTLKEFYREFAQSNPHLVRGDVISGTGSSPSHSSAPVQPAITNRSQLVSAREKSEFIKNFGLSQYEKLRP